MKNFKPSELPEDTVIKDKDEGVWMKEESGVWGEMTAHCSDCARTVTDTGRDLNEVGTNYIDNLSIKADDFFQDFKIIALPIAVVNELVKYVASYEEHEWHIDADRNEEILQDAIDAVVNPKKELTREEEDARQSAAISKISAEYKEDLKWRYMDSFENLYMEINEQGQIRTDFNGKIYSPHFDEDLNRWLTTVVDSNGEEINIDARYFVKRHWNKDFI